MPASKKLEITALAGGVYSAHHRVGTERHGASAAAIETVDRPVIKPLPDST